RARRLAAETAALAALVALGSVSAATPVGASEHAAAHAAHHSHPGVHDFLDQRLKRLPFGIVRNLELLLDHGLKALLPLFRSHVAPPAAAARAAAVVLRHAVAYTQTPSGCGHASHHQPSICPHIMFYLQLSYFSTKPPCATLLLVGPCK